MKNICRVEEICWFKTGICCLPDWTITRSSLHSSYRAYNSFLLSVESIQPASLVPSCVSLLGVGWSTRWLLWFWSDHSLLSSLQGHLSSHPIWEKKAEREKLGNLIIQYTWRYFKSFSSLTDTFLNNVIFIWRNHPCSRFKSVFCHSFLP